MRKRLLSRVLDLVRARSVHEGWRTYTSLENGKLIRACFAKNETWHKDFCADPFLFRYEGGNYLFYETVDAQGKGIIGCFKEVDGKWVNLGKVLEEPYHLSYPQVFQLNDSVATDDTGIYMVPESSNLGYGAVWLYKAIDFPTKWRKVEKLIDRPFADVTLLCHESHWYAACYTIPPHETAEVWHADSIFGPWRRHPQWCNINQSARLRRCGGRFIERDGQLFRIAQDCNGMYGKRLFAVPVKKISPTEYCEGDAFVWWDKNKAPNRHCHTYNEIDVDGKRMYAVDAHGYIKPIPSLAISYAEYVMIVIKRVVAKFRR